METRRGNDSVRAALEIGHAGAVWLVVGYLLLGRRGGQYSELLLRRRSCLLGGCSGRHSEMLRLWKIRGLTRIQRRRRLHFHSSGRLRLALCVVKDRFAPFPLELNKIVVSMDLAMVTCGAQIEILATPTLEPAAFDSSHATRSASVIFEIGMTPVTSLRRTTKLAAAGPRFSRAMFTVACRCFVCHSTRSEQALHYES